MLDSRPQGAAYRTITGQPAMSKLSLSEMMFDGKALWDDKALKFTLSYHFDKIIDMEKLKSQYGVEFKPHLMIPWIERYIEESERLNALNLTESVSLKECSERAVRSMMTPNQAEVKIARPSVTRTARR